MSEESLPVLLVASSFSRFRVPQFAALDRIRPTEFVFFAGPEAGPAGIDPERERLDISVRSVSQLEVGALALSARYSAVVCIDAGTVALPLAFAGATATRKPLVIWASLWELPSDLSGRVAAPVKRFIYRHAGAVASYGTHVSEAVRDAGAERVVEVPQAVDNDFWGASVEPDRSAGFEVVFVGRFDSIKGISTLIEAWSRSGLAAKGGRLRMVGVGTYEAPAEVEGIEVMGTLDPGALRRVYAGSDVLVLPSVRTHHFREPWGRVVNEAMNQGVAVIASDQVGAAAGGLVRDRDTGIVFPAGDASALGDALVLLHGDPELRRRLGESGHREVAAYAPESWALGMNSALEIAGAAPTRSVEVAAPVEK